MRGITPDPAGHFIPGLHMLLDRNLRLPMLEVNQANPDLQRANVSESRAMNTGSINRPDISLKTKPI